MASGRSYEMSAQHLGGHALPQAHLGCGTGRTDRRTFHHRNRKLGWQKIFHYFSRWQPQ